MFENLLTPSNITLATLVVSAIFFMGGKVRADIVALCSMLILLLAGVLTPGEALSGFSSSVVIMMVGLFVVGAGIFRTGLAKMISSKILHIGGKNENLLFLLIMLVTAFVGAFVSNTGTVAVMMPIVMSMAASAGINPRRYLMPMAFASGMGLFTLISTPPNLVIQDVITENGLKPLGFFSFAPVGAVIVAIGVVLLFFMSRLLTRKGDSAPKKAKGGKTIEKLVAEYNIASQTSRMEIPAGSPLTGKSLKELRIGTIYGVSVGLIVRTTHGRLRKSVTEEVAGPDSTLSAGDVIYVQGDAANIERFAGENGLTAETVHEKDAGPRSGEIGVAEIYIMPNSKLINHTLADMRFRENYNVSVLGIKRQGGYENIDIRETKLHSGDALLIQGKWKNIAGMDEQEDDFVLVGRPEEEAAKVTLDRKAPVAAGIMLAMVAVMVLDVIPAVAAVLLAALLMVATGCLRNMEEAYQSINWSSIVLIAAMIPMAKAFDNTGITASISKFLLTGLGELGPYGLLAIIYFTTSLVTMFLSNTATAVLFAPIAMKAAIGMGISPYPLMFAVAVAASMCFASPFSTPPNALVMSAGNYSFGDYVKVGLPLQLIMGAIMVVMLPVIFPF